MNSRKPRGNPNFFLKRAEREGVDVNDLMMKHWHSQQGIKSVMKPIVAARLLDKNSRTIAKIVQLLEILQVPGAMDRDPRGLINKRIEQLRSRVNRRLVRLAKWADLPVEERIPKDRMSNIRPVISANANIYSQQSALTRPILPLNRAGLGSNTSVSSTFPIPPSALSVSMAPRPINNYALNSQTTNAIQQALQASQNLSKK